MVDFFGVGRFVSCLALGTSGLVMRRDGFFFVMGGYAFGYGSGENSLRGGR